MNAIKNCFILIGFSAMAFSLGHEDGLKTSKPEPIYVEHTRETCQGIKGFTQLSARELAP